MIHNCKTPVVRQRKNIVDCGMYKTVKENEYLCKYFVHDESVIPGG